MFNDDMKQIEFMQTKVPVYLLEASDQSIEFLKQMDNYLTDVFDTTDIKYLIDYKWRNNYKKYMTMILFAFYIGLMIDTALYYPEK